MLTSFRGRTHCISQPEQAQKFFTKRSVGWPCRFYQFIHQGKSSGCRACCLKTEQEGSTDHGRSPFVQKTGVVGWKLNTAHSTQVPRIIESAAVPLALVGCEGLVPSWL